MRIRGAMARDSGIIDRLYKEQDFVLDVNNIESLIVIEDDNGAVFAVGSLVKILEAAFVVDSKKSRRDRIKALKLLLTQAEQITFNLGYGSYHSFIKKISVIELLKHKFGFKQCIGSAFIKFVSPSNSDT